MRGDAVRNIRTHWTFWNARRHGYAAASCEEKEMRVAVSGLPTFPPCAAGLH